MKEKPEVGSNTFGIDFDYIDRSQRRWWRWHRFPLIPIWETRPADQWNASGFSFSWLNLRLWTMSCPDIAVELNIEPIGINLRIMGFYLNAHIWLLGLPESWAIRIAHRLSRDPK